jgi:hypothetical protein
MTSTIPDTPTRVLTSPYRREYVRDDVVVVHRALWLTHHMHVNTEAGAEIGGMRPSVDVGNCHERRHKGGVCFTTADFKPED